MNVVVASSSRETTEAAFHENTWLGRSLGKLSRVYPGQIKAELALGRSDGLPKFYNEVLDANKEADAIIFCHDDMVLLDSFMLEKLEMALSEFHVVGLCGAKTPKDEAHVTWMGGHTKSGQIATSVKESEEAVLSANLITFGVTPSRASEMDGVFIAVCPRNIGELRFDDRFLYHHYDVDFTLTADKLGYRVGTWPIFTVHVSNAGDGYHSRSFRDSAEVFTHKWSNLTISTKEAND